MGTFSFAVGGAGRTAVTQNRCGTHHHDGERDNRVIIGQKINVLLPFILFHHIKHFHKTRQNMFFFDEDNHRIGITRWEVGRMRWRRGTQEHRLAVRAARQNRRYAARRHGTEGGALAACQRSATRQARRIYGNSRRHEAAQARTRRRLNALKAQARRGKRKRVGVCVCVRDVCVTGAGSSPCLPTVPPPAGSTTTPTETDREVPGICALPHPAIQS